MRLQGFILLMITMLFAATPALAQWKWKDARGQVVVSDIPPPRDIPERDVLQKPELVLRRVVAPVAASAASAPDAVAKPKVDPELEARRKKTEQEQTDRQRAEEDRVTAGRAENCKRARTHLTSLESGMRLARSNDKGEREILDDKARAEEMARTRQIISTDCR